MRQLSIFAASAVACILNGHSSALATSTSAGIGLHRPGPIRNIAGGSAVVAGRQGTANSVIQVGAPAGACADQQDRAAIERCLLIPHRKHHEGFKGDDDVTEHDSADVAEATRKPPATHEAPAAMAYHFSFRSGSSELPPTSLAALDKLGEVLTEPGSTGLHFRIEGHTDTVGSDDLNLTLSKARAEAVQAYLETKFHIDPGQIEAVGVGKSDLVEQTPDQTPDPRNRVVIISRLPT